MLTQIRTFLDVNPGAKAKEIATHLNAVRSDVNKLLHGNTEVFRQDEEFRWFLVKPTKLRLEFSGATWLTANDFEQTLCKSCSPLDSDYASVVFVVKGNVLLEALARLLALCNQLVAAGKDVTLDFEDSKSTLTYLDRLGFFDLLSSSVTVLPRRPKGVRAKAYRGNNDGVIELRAIHPDEPDQEIPRLLERSFVTCAGEQYSIAALTILSELFGNVVEHSGATSAGFAGLQFYKRGNHLQAVISDGGLGIVGTLEPVIRQRYPELAKKIESSNEHAGVALLKEVFSQGQISQVNQEGRGLGLKRSGELAGKFSAKISVRQSDFELRVRHSPTGVTFTHDLNLVRINGTHICFDFLLDASSKSR